MNEAETRAEHIDPALKAAGWGVVEGSKVLREHPITPATAAPAAAAAPPQTPRGGPPGWSRQSDPCGRSYPAARSAGWAPPTLGRMSSRAAEFFQR
jgi:hypothetical protein